MVKISSPCIIVNFKCYAYGEKALKLAKICKKISNKSGVSIAVCPQYVDISSIAKLKLPVIAQHADPITQGAWTGHVSAEAIKQAGAIGTLINHSEKPVSMENIKKCIELTKKLRLISVCCTPTVETARKIAELSPDFIAFEVPELIGTGRAISKERPESVKKFVKDLSDVNPNVVPLCGAGISTGKDVKIALELGTEGVLVASAVVKAEDPERVLINFVKEMR